VTVATTTDGSADYPPHHDVSTHGASAHAEHHSGSFGEQVRERIIGIGSMDRRLRLVVGAAVAQLVAAAIMVALRGTHLPTVIGDVTDNTESAIPVATFVVATTFLTVAWAFILAGALHAHWTLRILALGLFGWSFAVERDTVTGRTGGMIAALALMAAILGVAVGGLLRDRGRPHDGEKHAFRAPRLLLLIPLIGGLYITAWLTSASTDDVENFTTAVAQQLYNLQYALIPALVLAGADFADWGHLLGDRAQTLVHRARGAWPLLVVTAAVAIAMLVDARRVLDVDFGGAIGLGAILVGAVLVVAWLARPGGAWPHAFPFGALAAVVVVDATAGFLVEHFVNGSDDYVSDHIFTVSATLWAVAAVASAVVLVARRGRLRGAVVAALCFVVLVGVCNVLFGLSSIAAVFTGLHLSSDTVALDLDGVRAVAAIATLAVLAGVLVTRRVNLSVRLIGGLLALDVAVQVLAWVASLFDRSAQATETITGGFSIMAGVVLLLALLLEILGSGEAITNRDDRWFPRGSRVLLYLGYVVLVASAVLYFSSLHDPQSGALRAAQFDSEEWVHQGVLFLGVPLVATLFITRLCQGRRPATTPSPTSAALSPSAAARTETL
jgi:hypothetical protein